MTNFRSMQETDLKDYSVTNKDICTGVLRCLFSLGRQSGLSAVWDDWLDS